MAGINRFTGKVERDRWAHTQQRIATLLTTSRETRVMRRFLGSDLPRKVDASISPATIIDFYAAAAKAMVYEPCFKVARMRVDEATSAGHLALTMEGVYFPRGHLGDYSVSEPQTVAVPL